MQLSEVLRKARADYVGGRRRISPELVDYMGLLLDAAGNDIDLACEALEALDKQAPGGNFGFFADGGTWVECHDGLEPHYRYDKPPAHIAAVMGLAVMRAVNAEG